MKIPHVNLKRIVFLSFLIILGIISCYLAYGILFAGNHQPSDNSSSERAGILQDRKVNDTNFEVYEWNTNYPRWRVLVPLTYNELKEFPELEKSLHGVNTDPGVWYNDRRRVAEFAGNYSEYLRFHDAVVKNQTSAGCYPCSLIYEYHGQYYTLFYDKIGSHNVGGCERGNYNCT